MTELNGLYFNEDCILGARERIADNSIDLIISDPPYGIDGGKLDKHYNRNESFVVDGYIDVPSEKYGDFSQEWIREAARILRPGGSIYIVSGYTNLHHVLNALHSTPLVEVNHLIWKYNFGVYTKKKYISSHYHILYWVKPGDKPTFNTFCRYGDSEKVGKSSLNYLDREDVMIINREYKPGTIKNKNELPHELLSRLILYSSNKGDLVCDMFLGGFSTAIVAKGLGRRTTGFELSKNAYNLGIQRINTVNDGELLSCIRVPEENKNTNAGKSWTDDEIIQLTELYQINKDKSKKEIIEIICKSLGRGKWGIEAMLKSLNLTKTRDIKTGDNNDRL